MSRLLDWVSEHDPRSLAYPIRALIAGQPELKTVVWDTPAPLDQGQEGACVGFGWTGNVLSKPESVDLTKLTAVNIPVPNDFARFIYAQAQKIDGNPAPHEGSSVLAGAKEMANLGLVKEYRWALSIQDVVDTLVTSGPVVLGIDWHQGMYDAPGGVLTVDGPIVGGHCILAHGYSVKGEAFPDEGGIRLLNSWGADWGDGGHAWIRVSALEHLLKTNGEACVPLTRSYGP